MLFSEKQYFDRHLKLNGFGESAQNKLKGAKVLAIGAGGLGCPLLQYLVTAGVGQIGIVDGDTVSINNLHRQILYSPSDVGQYKAATASNKLKVLYPATTIVDYCFNLTRDNILSIISSYDVIVDGTDNFSARYLVNDACVIENKPLVSGAINDYTGQLAVFNYQGGPTYRCLYPESPDEENCYTCSINGVLNVLPGIVALHMANEVIKVITNYGDVLAGKLLLIDIRNNHYETISFEADPKNRKITVLPQRKSAIMTVNEALYYQQKNPEVQIIDVREIWEFEEYNIGGINIPIHELPIRKAEIKSQWPIIFLCQSGARSRQAAKLFDQNMYQVMTAYLG